jgi:hypothetical protein
MDDPHRILYLVRVHGHRLRAHRAVAYPLGAEEGVAAMTAVTQEDRDATADMLLAYKHEDADTAAEARALAVNVRAGHCDDTVRVQAFAAHREAAMERCADYHDREVERLGRDQPLTAEAANAALRLQSFHISSARAIRKAAQGDEG